VKHRKKGRKLNRRTSERKALFRGLIQALFLHGQIKTTEAKAKAIKRLAAKLITKAKDGSLHHRRQVLAFLADQKAANKLVDEIAPRFKKRTSGFTRFVRLGKRRGDDAMIVKLELVRDQVKGGQGTKKTKKKKVKNKKSKQK